MLSENQLYMHQSARQLLTGERRSEDMPDSVMEEVLEYYLKHHQLDSEDTVSQSWLESIGAEYVNLSYGERQLRLGPAQWFENSDGSGELLIEGDGNHKLRTRGAVRLFCESIQFSLNEILKKPS
jgi:hypothetical protein